jgi:hypothetical protein
MEILPFVIMLQLPGDGASTRIAPSVSHKGFTENKMRRTKRYGK